MTIGLGILGLVAAVLLGWLWTAPLGDANGPRRCGFAYGVGLTWISTMMGALDLLGVPLTPLTGGLIIGGPVIAWGAWRRWKHPAGAATGRGPGGSGIRDPVWWGTAVLLGLLLALVAWRAIGKPLTDWDAWDTYATKAKLIYLESGLSQSMFESTSAANYPLGIPLQEVWIAWAVGAWDDVAVKLLFVGYLVALLAIVYGELRDRWTPRAALGGTIFVASLPFLLQHGQEGYTNLPLAYYVLAGAVALLRYVRFTRHRELVLASAFAAGSVWTREDAVIVVASTGVLLLYWLIRTFGLRARRTWRAWALYLAFPVLVWGTWAATKYVLAISPAPPTYLLELVASAERVRIVVTAFVTVLFLQQNWLILWTLFALALTYGDRDIACEDSLFLVWPVLIYLGVIGVLAVSTDIKPFPSSPSLYQSVANGTVLSRLVLHVAPLAALWVALTYGRWLGLDRKDLSRD